MKDAARADLISEPSLVVTLRVVKNKRMGLEESLELTADAIQFGKHVFEP